MTNIFQLAKQVIDNRLPGTDEALFNNSIDQFWVLINTCDDIEGLLMIIEYDKIHYNLPLDLCTAIFNRLTYLGVRTSFVLNWYAFILKFYADPTYLDEVRRLEDEAEIYDNKLKNNQS